MSPEYLLPDENFKESMETVIQPAIEPLCQEWTVDGDAGVPLRCRFYINPGSTRVICISHGYTEYCERYQETIYIFLKNGYSVAICDHRGHGRSHRMVENLSKVHIDSYMTYVKDYHCFVEQVRLQFPDQELMLFGHSMGGCIAALYLETYPEDFRCCVLSSPMLEVNSGGVPRVLCKLYGDLRVLFGHGTDYLGSKDQEPVDNETFEDSCCNNPERFYYWKKLKTTDPFFQTAQGSIQWMTASLKASEKAVKGASRVHTPVLLCQAGADNMVLPGGQDRFVNACPAARILRIPGARHEIFNGTLSMRQRFWEKILEFYQTH